MNPEIIYVFAYVISAIGIGALLVGCGALWIYVMRNIVQKDCCCGNKKEGHTS